VYVDKWLQYQALWDMNAQALVDALGSDLHQWVALLTNMKAARGLIEHSATQQTFGKRRCQAWRPRGGKGVAFSAMAPFCL
jgi:dynein heavy chain 1